VWVPKATPRIFTVTILLARLFLLEHHDSPEIINIGCGEDISIRELAELTATRLVSRENWHGTLPSRTEHRENFSTSPSCATLAGSRRSCSVKGNSRKPPIGFEKCGTLKNLCR
jgi:hypothetical protein